MALHVRYVLERNQGNLDLRGDSMKFCLIRGLLGVYQKSRNVSY